MKYHKYHQTFKSPRFEIRNYLNNSFDKEISKDVFTGLTSDQKFIPSKYFYDERGSILFERICKTPEYYLTRTEISILKEMGEAIMESFENGYLVELGSGANWKIHRLIDTANTQEGENMCYVPVDVSEPALVAASEGLINKYRKLKVRAIVADFTQHMDAIPNDMPKLIIFFGSTIGNFGEVESQKFLRIVANSMKSEDRFLIGIDMLKPKTVLEAAYNDAGGFTRKFNRNVLHVINRELSADFNASFFDHLAFFNGKKGQIEMHLRAKKSFLVEIKDLKLSVKFENGETIRTEISRKFEKNGAIEMFSKAGLDVNQWFTDSKKWFSLVELVRNSF